jgi:SAM-dependent methyltransferase
MISLFIGDNKMQKPLIFTFACFLFIIGCSKSEPDPVITYIPVDTNDYTAGEIESTDLDTQPPVIDEFGVYVNEKEGFTAPETDLLDFLKQDVNEGGVKKPDVIYVPTPNDVVAKMLELANVQKDDLLYDLGCGDGRIVVTAARKYGCRSVGYDVDPKRIKESLENVERNNVGELVTIEQKDIFTLDLSNANVITLYLLPSLNVKLIPQLEKLKPGSRIVSHDFSMRGVKPDKVVEMMSVEDDNQHTVYLWTVPLNKRTEEEELLDMGVSENGFDNQLYEIPGLSAI